MVLLVVRDQDFDADLDLLRFVPGNEDPIEGMRVNAASIQDTFIPSAPRYFWAPKESGVLVWTRY